MGIPEAEMMDCSVGTIVWVRRRNGSWWPGRILGQDELSETHLMSPRSGTPVKLLGREDASVDWYNLEKSKRVKAFRCGEFDDCIQKAEAALGVPPRKREKYARREDAILHALELEKQQLEWKQQSAFMGSRKFPFSKKELDATFPSNNNSREDEPRSLSRYVPIKSQLLIRKVDFSFNGENMSSPTATRKINHSQIQCEDENAETMPRMRGLQDFGLKTAPSKRKNCISTACEGNKRTYPSESLIHAISLTGRGAGIAQQINGKRSSFLVKRKRSHGASIEDSLIRRRDRRRTIVQVLQSSAKLPAGEASQSECVGLPISVQEEPSQRGFLASSGGEKATSYDSIRGHSPDKLQTSHSQHGADSSFLYPSSLVEDRLMDDRESDSCEGGSFDNDMEETATVSDAPQILATQGSKNGGRYLRYDSSVFQGQTAKMGNKCFDDSRYSHYASQSHHFKKNVITGTNGVSKWQMKGKRNMRNLSKRHMDIPNGYADEDTHEAEKSLMNVNSGQWSSPEALDGYWEEPDDCFHPRFYSSELGSVYDGRYDEDGLFESLLVNVDLKVQASYQGEHVPLVSLMSRLNGKAIIGHPVQVEIMEGGSSELLLADSSFHADISERNKSAAVPPVWITARRTAMQRIPRSHPAAQENEESLVQCSPVEPKPPQKKLNTANLGHRSGSRKNMNSARRVAIGKLSKKLLKKTCLSNQKTRALSSLSAENKTSSNNNILQRPTPLVTSIPVETVFSRLREFFSGTPAAQVAEKKDAD